MQIKCCKEVAITDVVDVFNRGFSDYIIQHTWTVAEFESRFLGPEGNSLEHSFIAYQEEQPVGLILGGIRQYDGIKTLRCGAMCLVPSHRGSGVAQALFSSHKAYAIQNHCKQLFLEVIQGNDRAIRFYEKSGYNKVYNIFYHSKTVSELKNRASVRYVDPNTTYGQDSMENLKKFRNTLPDLHMNWQCEPESFNEQNGGLVLTAHLKSDHIATAAMSPSGRVYFMWVAPNHRGKGVATEMVLKMAEMQGVDKINFSTPNNSALLGFLKKLDFQLDTLQQFEMYMPL